jgi:PAS domain S-box-containing protein
MTSAPESAGAAAPAWAALLHALPDATWVVDVRSLTIVAANAAAGLLCGATAAELVGRPVLDFAATPEDQAFWHEAAEGRADAIDSDAWLRRADGATTPIARRVTPLEAESGRTTLCVVALGERAATLRRERELERRLAELQAALDSLPDGVLVVDLQGAICNFNRRFADLWELPDDTLLQRADDAVLDWMRRSVVDPAAYMRRLAFIDDAPLLRARDVLELQSGRSLERITVPQVGRGRPIGRVFTFREVPPPPAGPPRLPTHAPAAPGRH